MSHPVLDFRLVALADKLNVDRERVELVFNRDMGEEWGWCVRLYGPDMSTVEDEQRGLTEESAFETAEADLGTWYDR